MLTLTDASEDLLALTHHLVKHQFQTQVVQCRIDWVWAQSWMTRFQRAVILIWHLSIVVVLVVSANRTSHLG